MDISVLATVLIEYSFSGRISEDLGLRSHLARTILLMFGIPVFVALFGFIRKVPATVSFFNKLLKNAFLKWAAVAVLLAEFILMYLSSWRAGAMENPAIAISWHIVFLYAFVAIYSRSNDRGLDRPQRNRYNLTRRRVLCLLLLFSV